MGASGPPLVTYPPRWTSDSTLDAAMLLIKVKGLYTLTFNISLEIERTKGLLSDALHFGNFSLKNLRITPRQREQVSALVAYPKSWVLGLVMSNQVNLVGFCVTVETCFSL